MPLQIKNWSKFQHYQTGRGAPPWIKIYRDLLNDIEWFKLDGDSAKFLINCWIIASENNGNLPDSDTLAFRLRLDSKLLAKYLSTCLHWIISDDSVMLADCYQGATPETETETETETEVDICTNVHRLASKTPYQQLIDLYHDKCNYLPRVTVVNDSRKRAMKARFSEVMKTEKWTEEQTIGWFGEYYGIVNQSKFLTGRAAASNGHRPFKADWDWIHNPNNFVKVVEGKYNGG